MTYFTFRWILFLILLVVSGYFVLDFFSKLTTINVFSAISWGFRSRVSVGKGFPVRLFIFLAILFYPFLFTAVFVFLETPVQIYQMKNHHAGGLLGYRDGYKAHVYDPSRKTYIAYEHLNPPPAAGKFTETFNVVLLYKFKPSAKYYRDTMFLSLSWQLSTLLVAAVGLIMVYISLYLLSEAYIEKNNLQVNLSHHSIATKLHEITGMPIVKVLLIALSVYVLVLGVGIISVKMLRNYYSGLYKSHQQELVNKLLNSVTPMKTIKGRVIRRHYDQVSEFHSEGSTDNAGHKVGRGGKMTYYNVPVFTVEFRDLIKIPVYLNITTRPSKSTREDEERLAMLFSDKWKNTPNEMPELDFIINPDYSISLRENINK